MNDLELRIKKSVRSLSDIGIPKYKRVVESLKAFQGLDLLSIKANSKSEIESCMSLINFILQEYDLATFHDYKNISDSDLSEIIKIQLRTYNNIKGFSS